MMLVPWCFKAPLLPVRTPWCADIGESKQIKLLLIKKKKKNSLVVHAFPLVLVLLLPSSPTWITTRALVVDLVIPMTLMPLLLLAWTWTFSPSVGCFSIFLLTQHLKHLLTYITSLYVWTRDKIHLVMLKLKMQDTFSLGSLVTIAWALSIGSDRFMHLPQTLN